MTRPHVIGLTGSVGMGKSTTARIFADEGIPVWDADAAVHRLYAKGGAAVEAIRKLRPEAVGPDGVDRSALKAWIARDDAALGKIESVVHPLVAQDRAAFIAQSSDDLVVVDIPLLFEIGADAEVDTVVVVSAPEDVQRARVLSRPGMSEADLDRILSKQMPDEEKRRCADLVVRTLTMEEARGQVRDIVRDLRERHA